jgi:hypothetical protein
MLVLLCIAVCLLSGWSGFIFWWTKDFDLQLGDLPICIFAGVMGPLTWVVGGILHGGHSSGPVMLRRRK